MKRNLLFLFFSFFAGIGYASAFPGDGKICCRVAKSGGCECWSNADGSCYYCMPIAI